MLQLAQFEPMLLVDPNNTKVMGDFFPPNIQLEFLSLVLKTTLETLVLRAL
jgi:phosphonate transport system permease protein